MFCQEDDHRRWIPWNPSTAVSISPRQPRVPVEDKVSIGLTTLSACNTQVWLKTEICVYTYRRVLEVDVSQKVVHGALSRQTIQFQTGEETIGHILMRGLGAGLIGIDLQQVSGVGPRGHADVESSCWGW